MKWPKYTPTLPDFSSLRNASASSSASSPNKAFQSLGYDLNMIHLLVVDEDVSVFIDGCVDVSVAVRKQALTSLTELLQARPADQLILESWVAAALPLAADPGG
jgi:condensin-2 complex subunit D3